MLLSGALCRCDHILVEPVVEWHLNTLPPARRLAGLHLREAFDDLLARGCRAPPRRILHDNFAPNNHYAHVPGLAALLALHNGSYLGAPYPPAGRRAKSELAARIRRAHTKRAVVQV